MKKPEVFSLDQGTLSGCDSYVSKDSVPYKSNSTFLDLNCVNSLDVPLDLLVEDGLHQL